MRLLGFVKSIARELGQGGNRGVLGTGIELRGGGGFLRGVRRGIFICRSESAVLERFTGSCRILSSNAKGILGKASVKMICEKEMC